MSSDRKHALAELLEAAARGAYPSLDGRVEVVSSPPGLADAVVALTAHTVVAADVDPDAVAAQLPADSLSAPLQPPFLSWLAEQLRSEAGSLDVLLAAGPVTAAEVELVEIGDADHPRLRRAHRYRSEVSVYEPANGGAVLIVGRGLAGRYEVSIEVDPEWQGKGLGRSLAHSARALVPAQEPLFAQVAPGNAASLRAFLAAGYRPIGAEVLFLKDQPIG
jgi:RimJ/RimL family protein N-acetyltransferase